MYREYFNVPKGPTKCIWFGGNWFDANWQITALWNNWNTTRTLTGQKPIVHCTSNHNYKLNCGYWFTNFSRIHPTSCVGCYAGKSIKNCDMMLKFPRWKAPRLSSLYSSISCFFNRSPAINEWSVIFLLCLYKVGFL